MRKYINGKYIDMTAEETAAMEADAAKFEAYERTRPLTAEEVTAMLIRQQINTLSVDDSTALRMREFYPRWEARQAYTAGFKLRYGGLLYKVLQSHTSQPTWTPTDAPSLWAKCLIDPESPTIPEWEQPDSTNPYSKGDKVTHNGKTWESLIDGNVWEPGVTGTESLWKEVP